MIYLSVWSIATPIDIVTGFLLPQSTNPQNKLLPLIQKHRESQIEQLANGSQQKSDELLFINYMVSEWMKTENEPYPKSSWISHKYLYEINEISFLFYPSASTKSKSTCLAIHPNFVDNFMRIEKIYNFTLNETGFIPSSTIFRNGIKLNIRNMDKREVDEISSILNRAVKIKQ